jgi:hypothetical protein
MLSREDSRRLAQLERQLQRDDPEFCARMAGDQEAPGPPRRVPLSLLISTVLLYLTAIVLSLLAWWIPATLAALVATMAASTLARRLLSRRRSHRR